MARYLADKSALARMPLPEVRTVLTPLIRQHEVATCGMVQLEVLYSARGYNDLLAIRFQLAQSLPLVPILQVDFDRAIDVITELARRAHHRAVGLQDLVIAAVAERAGLAVLHYDADYELVAAVTGQPVEWVVPRGSVP